MTGEGTTPQTGTPAVDVGALIHQLLWRRGMRQTELAKALGVTQATVSRKLHGRQPLTVQELVQIAAVLGVDPGELLTAAGKLGEAVDDVDDVDQLLAAVAR